MIVGSYSRVEFMDNSENKRKVGKPKMDIFLKKKSCNIILSTKEIKTLEHLASAYGLNKSSFIALFIDRIAPVIIDSIYGNGKPNSDDLKLIRLLNQKLDIAPTLEQADKYFNVNPRVYYTNKAKDLNRNTRRELNKAVENNQDLKEQISNLNKDIESLNQDLEIKDRELSYQRQSSVRSLEQSQKIIERLERKLKNNN